ncbi:MAG TPA: Nif3-like dinuclear metal center hexameric protein [Pseudolysinimonas sp.]|nr:Nif3-like dinuclear metal center hexameric protein [Pseudolysinimonas sp.]
MPTGPAPTTLADVNAAITALWPLDTAEAWDAPGLLSGDPSAEVHRIHLAVDAVLATIDEAISLEAELLLVHHPLLLRGVTHIAEDSAKGAAVARLIRAGCALVAAHTNADIVERGTSAMLATALGLTDTRALVPGTDPAVGLGRIGHLVEPLSLGALARRLAEVLPATASGVRVAGEYDREVRTVALCAGAGDSLLGHADVRAADVYITSDLRHHPASEAMESAHVSGGPALIDVSHWASEWLWLDAAAEQLRAALPHISVSVSDLRTDPWDFAILQ